MVSDDLRGYTTRDAAAAYLIQCHILLQAMIRSGAKTTTVDCRMQLVLSNLALSTLTLLETTPDGVDGVLWARDNFIRELRAMTEAMLAEDAKVVVDACVDRDRVVVWMNGSNDDEMGKTWRKEAR